MLGKYIAPQGVICQEKLALVWCKSFTSHVEPYTIGKILVLGRAILVYYTPMWQNWHLFWGQMVVFKNCSRESVYFLYDSQWDQLALPSNKVESYAEITLTSARTTLLLVCV